MEAKIKIGIVALEEYIQEYYVGNYDEFSKTNLSKIEAIKTKKINWFYKTNEGFVVDSEGHALYLFVKKELPKEIQEQLVGGDAGEGKFKDYLNLNDVYGVTSDLKVYYCNNGINSILGVEKEELDLDSPTRPIVDSDSPLGGLLGKNENGIITMTEVRKVGTLTIEPSSGLENLEELYKLTSLKELNLKDLNNKSNFSLSGIENTIDLRIVRFINCDLSKYDGIEGLTNLKELYLEQSCDDEVKNLFEKMGKSDYNKLEIIGIYGVKPLIEGENSNFWIYPTTKGTRTNIKNISSLSELTSVTKQSIKKLYLNNNQITDISCLIDFTQVETLQLGYNSITSLKDCCNNMSLLRIVTANHNLLKDLDGLQSASGLEYLGLRCNCLGGIDEEYLTTKSLRYIDLESNENLCNIDVLANQNGLVSLFLGNCPNLNPEDVTSLASIYNKIASNMKSIDDGFLRYLSTESERNLKKCNLSDKSDDLISLIGNQYITKLCLDGNTSLRKY